MLNIDMQSALLIIGGMAGVMSFVASMLLFRNARPAKQTVDLNEAVKNAPYHLLKTKQR